MASRSDPFDESDDFDWEAAVREIDSACAAATASASNAPVNAGTCSGTKLGGTGSVKQSTLERFVNSFTKRRKGNDGFVKSKATENNTERGNFNGIDKSRVCANNTERGNFNGFDKSRVCENRVERRNFNGFDKSRVCENRAERGNFNESDKSRVCENRVERKDSNKAEYQSSFVQIDPEAAKTWIYPVNVNVPKREYQYKISKLALFSNTLVALPTGLGKTLIAAVVMYNYFRWFPEGKIVFAAPSRPLVVQQIEACHNIVGIPQEWTIYMTGGMQRTKRSKYWQSKRVFFLTPQILQKDIETGICLVKNIVCLVIDEAHRAQGNFASCVVVRELLSIPVQLRILALTATPGSKVSKIQDVIKNLSISTLEYRDEDDPDVKPYIHNRALELIQVPLGEDTSTIHDLLLDVIRPYASFLSSFGLLYRRDISTFSPCEILIIKDNFKKGPPPNVPQDKYQEVENTFFTLITLYHLRKLLSSHGIRPAFEMLDEKLKDRAFNVRMSKTEAMAKIKLLMQRNIQHGAPFPKLVKMIEILTDHFTKKDPKESRVIIFSNFRGSVKDIMESLSKIGDLVKATEFIGQSSGKNSKGQTQKVQQAVLKKFREGGYNVIVATSIGEEGLDIMEVDLVICFDANVSPLRMTQRMGRTGRKRDGRVVVLACEGSEIKGYSRKQEKNKAIKKHMRNASKSFDFYPSPRMIPHVYKPEVQFLELSIEEYIPQGQGVKTQKSKKNCGSPFLNKISDKERDLIAKYTLNSNEWKPSLIAFPSCQALPSCIYKVHHSFRSTHMLIDAMQCLQGMADPFVKVGSPSLSFDDAPHLRDASIENNVMYSPSVNKFTDLDAADKDTNSINAHNFLFGGENFIQIDPNGSVSIKSLPSLPFNLSSFVQTEPTVPNKLPSENTEEEILNLNSPNNEIIDLSPRLSLYIEGGIVPESPLIPKSSGSKCVNEVEMSEKVVATPLVNQVRESEKLLTTPLVNLVRESEKVLTTPLVNQVRESSSEKVLTTPLVNLVRESDSEDWLLKSATGPSSSVKPKYKRLRKLGEIVKEQFEENSEGIIGKENKNKDLNRAGPDKGSKKAKRRVFIEEEAEVSKNASVSEDEGVSEDEDEYEDSFIDDATNPSYNEQNTHLEPSGDILAFYRRSLLTQSPIITLPKHLMTPNCYNSSSKTSTSYSSENTPSTHQGPQSFPPHPIENSPLLTHQSESRKTNIINRLTNNASNIEDEFVNKLETKKRKLSFQQEQQSTGTGIGTVTGTCTASISVQERKPVEILNDDDFFMDIDFDLLEAQATELLRQKTQLSNVETKTTNNNSVGIKENFDNLCDPSFDLGF